MIVHLGVVAACLLGQVAEWPVFRGPAGDGVAAPDADPPVEWSESNNVAWKTALPGRGRSSPVILGGRVFVTAAREQGLQRKRIGPDDMQTAEHVTLLAAAVDRASGRLLWETPLREIDAPDPVHWLNSWATPTPAVQAGRLFCDFGGCGTWCLDPETGKVLWEKKVPLDSQVGPGSSLGLHGNLLLLVRDGRDAQCVVALDAKGGETVWRTERPPVKTGSPNQRKSFSSPIVAELGGAKQVVAPGPHWMASYDLATGKELWRLRHGEGFSIGSAPVAGLGLVFAGTGCHRPNLLAIRPDGQGDVTETHLAWRAQKGVPVMSSPVLVGEQLFWVSDEGIATCVEARSGAVKWQERLGEGHLASPIAAAGRVYLFGKEGKTTVVKAAGTFERLAESRVEGAVTATPAAVGKALYVRTDTHLYRIEGQ